MVDIVTLDWQSQNVIISRENIIVEAYGRSLSLEGRWRVKTRIAACDARNERDGPATIKYKFQASGLWEGTTRSTSNPKSRAVSVSCASFVLNVFQLNCLSCMSHGDRHSENQQKKRPMQCHCVQPSWLLGESLPDPSGRRSQTSHIADILNVGGSRLPRLHSTKPRRATVEPAVARGPSLLYDALLILNRDDGHWHLPSQGWPRRSQPWGPR